MVRSPEGSPLDRWPLSSLAGSGGVITGTGYLTPVVLLLVGLDVSRLLGLNRWPAVPGVQDPDRVPKSIITNNGTRFTREKFLDFWADNNIRVDWVVITHPRTNGQVKHANKLILQSLKPHIFTQEGKDVHAHLSTRTGKWAAEVPSVLWSLRTTPNRSTNFTLFLSCMAEVVLPTKQQYGSPWSKLSNQSRKSMHNRMSSIHSKNQGISPS
jgi:hypothetical protein